MKRPFFRMLSILLCAALLLSLLGCTQDVHEETTQATTETTEPPVTEPEELTAYREAAAAVQAAASLTMRVTASKTVSVGGETFYQESRQTLSCAGLDSDTPSYHSQETVSHLSVYTTSYDEVYSDGTVYLTVDDTTLFSSACSPEDYARQHVPPVLLDPDLYSDITASGTTLTFTAPSAAESWAVPEGAEFVDASGTALVSAGGDLQKSAYTVTYTYGSAEITLEVEAYVTLEDVSVQVPADTDSYTPVESLEAVYLTGTAVGSLHQAKTFSSSYLESLFSQAAGYLRNVSDSRYFCMGDDYVSKIETGMFAQDYTTMESYEYNLVETFVDGVYSYAEDGGDPVTQAGVTAAMVESANSSTLTSYILDFGYWKEASTTDLGSLYLIELTLTDEFGAYMEDYLNTYLWNDADFLDNYASAYQNTELTAYIGIDKYTGMVTASGYYYEGAHTIDGYDYLLSFQVDRSYEAPSLGAYHEITDEMLPEEAPETTPTPLFYHVTGEDGQEMWLFGTIHVGDERTAYLPQEIYDALGSSDALALEYYSKRFDEQAEEDEAVQEAISEAYYYSDGTSTVDHISPELFEQALPYLKATGSYNMNAEYMKPYLWQNLISNFYLRQGYCLTNDQGVESRLEKYAEDNGIEIRDIESGLFQVQMLTGYSDELQAILLEETLESSAEGYWTSSMEMFELWCAGDEAAMRERVSCEVDTSELTEEELAEYEAQRPYIDEYNDAMSHDRNEGMLNTAIEYLESGETIFYAVGLAHLLDETNGLVDALWEAGYTVELVKFS